MSSPLLAAWLNDLNPIALRLTDALQVRWYGLAYVAGFLATWAVMVWFIRRGRGVIAEKDAADFITYAALLGVMVGGRLGYMLLYDRPAFFENPLRFFQLTQGGMASHGGIAGLFIFTWFYAQKKKVSWPGLGDMLVVGAPLGIFFGRIANFINGELWGHESQVPWAVKFPQEALTAAHPALNEAVTEHVLTQVGPEANGRLHEHVIQLLRSGDTALRTLLEHGLPARHPSQLYAALLEGLLLFAVLFAVRWKWKNLPHGVLTGLFFIGYAVCRLLSEHWRVPDARGLAWLEPLSPGQQYSLPMILVGAAFLIWAGKHRAPVS